MNPINSRLIHTAWLINDKVPRKIATIIMKALKGIKNLRIVALGVTYKPDTSDVRNSPALEIIQLLRDDGYLVEAFDPLAAGYEYSCVRELAAGADCLVVLVEHRTIREELAIAENEIKKAMRNPLIIRFYSGTIEN